MEKIKTEDAVGMILCHDMTQIIKDQYKDARFRKGHRITEEDIPVLLSMGKEHIYIWKNDPNLIHENEGAAMLYDVAGGAHMHPTDVKEGKINAIADSDGLFIVDTEKLNKINAMGDLMIASRHGGFPVKKGDMLAGMRVIPLAIEKEKAEPLLAMAGEEKIFNIKPFVRKKAAVIGTGSEVLTGRIVDTFTPVIIEKLAEYGVDVIYQTLVGDNPAKLSEEILAARQAGAEVIVCTGGMSVDPDDNTPAGIRDSGADIVSYGAPVLPGAMFMLAYLDGVPVMGLPGCVMYSKRTVFDLVLPKVLANEPVTADMLSKLGEGGLCLSCELCTYPNCGFGK